MSTASVTPYLDLRLRLGECPVWDEVAQALYVLDIPNKLLYRCDWASKALRSWTLPDEVGSFGLTKDGNGAVVALRCSVHILDFATGTLAPLAYIPAEAARPRFRFNDGKVGPDGRFWAGTIDGTMGPNRDLSGILYRFDPDGRFAPMRTGIGLSNGIAWSPSGTTMYQADFAIRVIRAWDYDLATGDIANERLFRQMDDVTGWPDGAAVDAEGYYWSAGFRAGRVNRIAPDGTIERTIELPVKFVTMPCFGGPDLRTLFITSLIHPLEDHPDSGKIFSVRVDVPGLPGARFGR